ncbi:MULTISPECIES: HAMP domain-containing sensor histidine kinase [unclassified Paenibacillus]|uniref:sensor histidine kinase n=1 Tax=unclassified Paenibacillus TaxID=185978 RepID=UPI002475C51C|nr:MULTISPECIES: HAMP domain-containing sensor histidine kinase [unclassified Paenibacillus]MDH6427334.1 signal transduction histidine kinase [Paenibacillus sp. PastH-4]MDH6443364.1 signal transduction histidine kinase [Paenibacillus sp. PastF-4]MDH6525932.1 signal transduction histidine kinase [Paenibacillus sp. PastH-3]
MLRNREFRWLLLTMTTISLLAIIGTAFISSAAMGITAVTSVLLIGCCLLFTRWRYREIEKLSGYLRQISSGNYSLDVRDNQEGELSILKNDIYKVTLMLSEQRLLLQEDKIKLTNAISDISHQLKTPLTSMTVMADLLSDPDLDVEKRIEFTRKISLQLDRVGWLVSSLLKFSKIDAGTIQFKKDSIKVKKLVQKSMEPILIPMDIKEQRILIEGEDATSLIGDYNWTTEAMINILKNCVEHTPTGGEITISFAENTLFTEIVITDNGKGIPKAEIPYIFKRFYKGTNANEDSVGIGLALAQSIITEQNGTIDVVSEVGKGTQFRIKFYKQVI